MFHVKDEVEVISDQRIGTVEQTRGRIDAVNMPGAKEEVEMCLVRFGNDMANTEWFKPEQLRLIK